MILLTQDQFLRAVQQRLMTALDLPESRVYLTQEPNFPEAVDYAVQISPISSGAQNEMNRVGLGFVTERFAVTSLVRSASDYANKQNRQLAGVDRGVVFRQSQVRAALIQNDLDGKLQVDIRFVSSGPIKTDPRQDAYIMMTDVYVASYATPWPVAGRFRYGWSVTTPTWATLLNEANFINDVTYTATGGGNAVVSYFWFAFPQELHNLGVTISTAVGVEPFYNDGFPPLSGPSVGNFVEDGVTYFLYRRGWSSSSPSLTYFVEAG